MTRADDDIARRTERVGNAIDAWSATYVEAYTSAANLVLATGHTAAAVALHAEVCRRFPTRVGIAGFAALDAALHATLTGQDTTCDTEIDL